MLRVIQCDVAQHAGVDRTTVSKILNNYSYDSFDEATRRKILKAASQIGYLHPKVVNPKRRAAPRKKFRAGALIKMYLFQDGSLCSECRGEIVNISPNGMFLRLLEGKPRVFPSKPFYLEVILTGSRQQTSKLKAVPIRLANLGRPNVISRCKLGLGVQFIDPIEYDQLRKLVSSRLSRKRRNI